MTRIIAIASGKGGVGKTTITANLAAALTRMRRSVIAIDGNLGTANLGMHLGIPLYPITLHDVLRKDFHARDALYKHRDGFRVIPADISLRKFIDVKTHHFMDVFYKFVGDAEYVLIDCPPGVGREARAVIEACDELLTITNPEMTALTDAVKIEAVAADVGTRNIGVVINRVNRHRHEVNLDVATRFLGMHVIGKIHEDNHMTRATAYRRTVVTHKPNARSSRQLMELASLLTGNPIPKKRFSLFSKLR
ncbi:MAG: cell division ATPase MinD [Candidatus Aenigmatarchaeota archaeon]|nr:cell division ATPase MinD [Nanoarchaeota archaeon]